MFDIFPDHSHRTPQQIADDSGGSFEPVPVHRTPYTDHPDDTLGLDEQLEHATRRGHAPRTRNDPDER